MLEGRHKFFYDRIGGIPCISIRGRPITDGAWGERKTSCHHVQLQEVLTDETDNPFQTGLERLYLYKTSRGIKMARETVAGVCGICPGGCGVNVVLVDGKVEKILPIKDHPVGVVCVRGLHSKEIIYSRDRLKYPLRRVGEKGRRKI